MEGACPVAGDSCVSLAGYVKGSIIALQVSTEDGPARVFSPFKGSFVWPVLLVQGLFSQSKYEAARRL